MIDTASNASQAIRRRRSMLRCASRRCGFEQLEPRQLLAADLTSGIPDLASGSTGAQAGEIRGTVYASQHGDCENHSSDLALSSVVVQLLDERGKVLEEKVTDQAGHYTFADLLPGQYAVRQINLPGYLDGAATVGTGGGIAFEANVVGEIVVQPGEALQGYDFCDLENVPDAVGPTDRPIVPHQRDDLIVMPFQVPTAPTPIMLRPDALIQPAIELATAKANVPSAPLTGPRPAEIFGGSSQAPNDIEAVKTWDEYLLDDLFAQSSFLELATEAPSDSAALDAWLAEVEASSSDPFADGYTANSVEWPIDEKLIDLHELMHEGRLLVPNEEQPTTGQQPVAEVARREKSTPPQ